VLPPECAKNAYYHSQYDTGSTDFWADAEFVNNEKYPLFEKVRDKIQVFTINKGEALYIPKHWLHEVITTDDSMSVNVFLHNSMDYFIWNRINNFLYLLHSRGLYKKGNCVCCVNKGQELTQ
jgi:hypothetical protein